MQVQKKSEAFWLLLFPGRVILFFQIRALTGFWFCILKWFKSVLTLFGDGSMFLCLDQKNWMTKEAILKKRKKAHVGEQKQRRVQWLQNKLWLTSWTRAQQVFGPRGNIWTRPVQYFGSLNTAGLFSFLKSCYRDWLAVDYSVYSSRFLEYLLDLWP